MASSVAAPDDSAHFKSRLTRLALCAAMVEPGTADVVCAAWLAALNALKNFAMDWVTAEVEAPGFSPSSPCAAIWLPDTADLSKPNDDNCAVVASTSACMRWSALDNNCETAAVAPVACDADVPVPVAADALLPTVALIFMETPPKRWPLACAPRTRTTTVNATTMRRWQSWDVEGKASPY